MNRSVTRFEMNCLVEYAKLSQNMGHEVAVSPEMVFRINEQITADEKEIEKLNSNIESLRSYLLKNAERFELPRFMIRNAMEEFDRLLGIPKEIK